MPNFAVAFKGEILRLSRKTVKQQLSPLRSITAAQRRHIAALRKQVAGLERELATLRRAGVAKPAPVESSAAPARFVAKGLVSLRSRLGLSADDFGKLLGVSGVSVYNWEHKKAKPRPALLSAIGGLRALGKREAQAKLEMIGARNVRKGSRRASRKRA